MVSVRTAKSKGSSMEYDTQYSLEQWTTLPVTRTAERGYQREYDICIGDLDTPAMVIECKRLKGISWNELVKLYKKLDGVTIKNSIKMIVFKSNRQPALVFKKTDEVYTIETFRDTFGVDFLKHPSTRAKKVTQ